MNAMTVRGNEINYRIIGDAGPIVALMPGERRPHDELVNLAESIAKSGCRVLLHDRRNTGASEISIDGESEHVVWAEDLLTLVHQLKEDSFYVGGSSSGARVAITLALRHPDSVRGLLLWRVTGGVHASDKLAKKYYGDPVEVAKNGMAAVCSSPHFLEPISRREGNREKLMAMKPEDFIATMQRWQAEFVRAASLPVIGATEEQIRQLAVPACILAGNDKVHSPMTARRVTGLLPKAELHEDIVSYRADDALLEEWDRGEWRSVEPKMAKIFGAFVNRIETGCFAIENPQPDRDATGIKS
ncbi:putative hydrolase or acyltransferase of alpha/beta superfamily [Hoeflea sp. IMCC20628]|uniref:alpha/beta fold hydrolase n=1 Tax=Hoeflea sp. IMCC20628 TaxID=1620421 RepID=UPI00063AF36B|nr:alpha/beta hydrolase [Hoeflea sp. IMCC20628]AKI00721.1 putative hydrolase or acyltransferase of alpha/beta superfamily [Hoeflea sp. IMCC20628]